MSINVSQISYSSHAKFSKRLQLSNKQIIERQIAQIVTDFCSFHKKSKLKVRESLKKFVEPLIKLASLSSLYASALLVFVRVYMWLAYYFCCCCSFIGKRIVSSLKK